MQSSQPGENNISYKCPVNLCSDKLTVAQLHPDFETYANDNLCCPHDVGLNVYVLCYHSCFGPGLMIVMIFSSYAARKVKSTNLVLVEVIGSCESLDGESICLFPVHNRRKRVHVSNTPMLYMCHTLAFQIVYNLHFISIPAHIQHSIGAFCIPFYYISNVGAFPTHSIYSPSCITANTQ